MKSTSANKNLSRLRWIVGAVAWVCLSAAVSFRGAATAAKKAPAASRCRHGRRQEL